MALITEKVINRARLALVPLMRYKESMTAAVMLMLYLPQLTRCGKTFRVSL